MKNKFKKRELTQNQIDFLLEYFFKNGKYAGWRNIATKLIKDGECIVAGIPSEQDIWIGGVGNFINITDDTRAIECSLYQFDLEHFMSSELFKEIKNLYVKQLTQEVDKLTEKLNEIKFEF